MKIHNVKIHRDVNGALIVLKFGYVQLFAHHRIRKWCNETFGLAGPDGLWRDHLYWGEISFNDEAHVTMFLLRWS